VTWFRVDDTLAAHDKARAAGLPALGLWVVAGSYSSQQLTSGRIPAWFVQSWPGGRKAADALVKAGLWHPDGDGWVFHDWGQCNPTREQEQARREQARKRKQRSRESRDDTGGQET
jgi:hypothetical protein